MSNATYDNLNTNFDLESTEQDIEHLQAPEFEDAVDTLNIEKDLLATRWYISQCLPDITTKAKHSGDTFLLQAVCNLAKTSVEINDRLYKIAKEKATPETSTYKEKPLTHSEMLRIAKQAHLS